MNYSFEYNKVKYMKESLKSFYKSIKWTLVSSLVVVLLVIKPLVKSLEENELINISEQGLTLNILFLVFGVILLILMIHMLIASMFKDSNLLGLKASTYSITGQEKHFDSCHLCLGKEDIILTNKNIDTKIEYKKINSVKLVKKFLIIKLDTEDIVLDRDKEVENLYNKLNSYLENKKEFPI
ncbi:MAG: hypothetical protein ACRC57_03620 [Sarcina sp.]